MGELQLTGGREAWTSAESLDDLGRLMAAWLRGDVTYQPGYGVGCDEASVPDTETAELVSTLAELNELGLVTTFSQPGEDVDGWRQRAAVGGHASEEVVARLAAALAPTDLVVLQHPPGASEGPQVVVSLDGATENTWLGAPEGVDELIDLYRADLTPAAMVALVSAWQVHVIDPLWGRNDVLWPALLAALRDG